jgi:hypothetical protein
MHSRQNHGFLVCVYMLRTGAKASSVVLMKHYFAIERRSFDNVCNARMP